MADVIDVQNALVAIAAQAVYPNGTALASVTGAGIKVYAGWPGSAQLDADLRAGVCNVSVYPTQIERNTTRYPRDWQDLSINPATLTMTISGQTVTVGGTLPATYYPQNAMVMVDGLPYVYTVQATDTLSSIATALSALIPGATSSGAVITMPGSITAARTGAGGVQTRELRRQARVFTIVVWADTPQHRDTIAGAIDVVMAATDFITMPDSFDARVIYRGSNVIDSLQKAKLYRRDLAYDIEFATTETATATQITQIQQNDSVLSAVSSTPLNASTTYY